LGDFAIIVLFDLQVGSESIGDGALQQAVGNVNLQVGSPTSAIHQGDVGQFSALTGIVVGNVQRVNGVEGTVRIVYLSSPLIYRNSVSYTVPILHSAIGF